MITFKTQLEILNYIKKATKITLKISKNKDVFVEIDDKSGSFDICSLKHQKGLNFTTYDNNRRFLYLKNDHLKDVIIYEISKLKQCKYIETN